MFIGRSTLNGPFSIAFFYAYQRLCKGTSTPILPAISTPPSYVISTEDQGPVIGHRQLHRTDALSIQQLLGDQLQVIDGSPQHLGPCIGPHATSALDIGRDKRHRWMYGKHMRQINLET